MSGFKNDYEIGYDNGYHAGYANGFHNGEKNKKIEKPVEEPKVCILCGIPFDTLHEWTCVHTKCPHNMH